MSAPRPAPAGVVYGAYACWALLALFAPFPPRDPRLAAFTVVTGMFCAILVGTWLDHAWRKHRRRV